jgi:hypothetical protein
MPPTFKERFENHPAGFACTCILAIAAFVASLVGILSYFDDRREDRPEASSADAPAVQSPPPPAPQPIPAKPQSLPPLQAADPIPAMPMPEVRWRASFFRKENRNLLPKDGEKISVRGEVWTIEREDAPIDGETDVRALFESPYVEVEFRRDQASRMEPVKGGDDVVVTGVMHWLDDKKPILKEAELISYDPTPRLQAEVRNQIYAREYEQKQMLARQAKFNRLVIAFLTLLPGIGYLVAVKYKPHWERESFGWIAKPSLACSGVAFGLCGLDLVFFSNPDSDLSVFTLLLLVPGMLMSVILTASFGVSRWRDI